MIKKKKRKKEKKFLNTLLLRHHEIRDEGEYDNQQNEPEDRGHHQIDKDAALGIARELAQRNHCHQNGYEGDDARSLFHC